MVVLVISCLATFSFGFAFAYGESYVIGTKNYFTSITKNDPEEEQNEIKWIQLFATCALTT